MYLADKRLSHFPPLAVEACGFAGGYKIVPPCYFKRHATTPPAFFRSFFPFCTAKWGIPYFPFDKKNDVV
ncbi:hypothetical protein [Dialister sp.]|jgi:hypothetical protein|uniref:hypothetical protein n=1 Tax=Dialister sp. TaxID=1955814 RepID=UPI003A5C1EF4